MADRRDWAGERGDFPDLPESDVRGTAYVGERPRDGGVPGSACSYPYMLEAREPEAPLFEGAYAERFDKIVSRYPDTRGALLPVLNMAQEVRGWLSPESMDRVAELLGLSPAYVRGVATFYTMYNKRPVGRHLIQVCTNVCCNICGADDVTEAFLKATGTEPGEISEDGLFTVIEAECLGACGFPTVVQVNDRYYENVKAGDVPAILDDLRRRNGESVRVEEPSIALHEVEKRPDAARAVTAEAAGDGVRRPPPDRPSPALPALARGAGEGGGEGGGEGRGEGRGESGGEGRGEGRGEGGGEGRGAATGAGGAGAKSTTPSGAADAGNETSKGGPASGGTGYTGGKDRDAGADRMDGGNG